MTATTGMKTSAAALFLLLLAPFLAPMTPAYACSIGDFGTPERQREKLLKSLDNADLVLVGTVTDERSIGTLGRNDAYESTVTADAVLAGDAAGATVVVGRIAFDSASCTGGPRLREGERVLLALDRGFIESDGGAANRDIWRLHHFLGKVRLDDGEAVSQYATDGVSLGEPEGLIRDYGAALGSSDAQIDAAVAAAVNAVVTPGAGAGSQDRPWLVRGAGIAAILVAVAVAVHALRR